MRVALAQVDCKLGDVGANLRAADKTVQDAVGDGADLVVFPELALNGYALSMASEDTSLSARDERLAALSTWGPDVLVGFYEDGGMRRYNSAGYLTAGSLTHVQRKLYLPNYLVWEERKHASPGQSLRAFDTAHGRVAVLVCNDAWQLAMPWLAVQDGAETLLVVVNSAADGGPDCLDNVAYWCDVLQFIARMQQVWVVFVNRVGEENGARFWGGSRVLDPYGHVVAQAPLWEPALVTVNVDPSAARRRRREVPLIAEARLGLVAREVDRLIREGGDA
ncbi:MAG: amidohydrolase [Micromonosporaceae bacterium]|nr:amidohydrolase [Micromonosporaceae bacterium]